MFKLRGGLILSLTASSCRDGPRLHGKAAPVVEVLAAVTRIVRACAHHVDFERGHRLAVSELVERFAATGAVGLNLEDSDPSSGESASGWRLQLQKFNQASGSSRSGLLRFHGL